MKEYDESIIIDKENFHEAAIIQFEGSPLQADFGEFKNEPKSSELQNTVARTA
ncbi:hypothetical protein [Chryseobacterium wanjuense]